MKLLVVSICKDEAEMIGKVLDGVPDKIKGVSKIEKLVIDDGSSDNTAEVARSHGADVISDGSQKRLALRFREALEEALSREADIMVNIDGDLQFDPAEIPLMISPILDGEADFVAANRFVDAKTGEKRRPEGMPVGKYLGNKLGAYIIGKLSDHEFSDVTCGFRAYNRDAMFSLNLHGNYTYTQESFQVLAMKKMRIVSVPTSIKYYPGRKSRVVRSFWQFLIGSAMNILRAYRDYAPLSFFGNLGSFIFAIGFILSVFFMGHWVVTGQFTPYKFVGFTAIYFISLALIIWIVGMMADMLDRLLGNQEKIIERLKRIEYDNDDKEKQQ